MTIDELYRKTNLTKRAYETCKSGGLHSLQALLDYYTANKSFKRIKGCGSKTNFELIRMSRYYLRQTPTAINIEEIMAVNMDGKKEIIDQFILDQCSKLSVRSYNALASYLKTDWSIRNIAVNIMYAEHFSFDLLRNIGKKSVQELDLFVKTIKDFTEQDCEVPLPTLVDKQIGSGLDADQKIIKEKLDQLDDWNKSVLERQIGYAVKHLSKRAYNALSKALSEDFTLENFSNKILLVPQTTLYEFRGIGEQSVKEITLCAEKVRRFFVKLLTETPDTIGSIINKLVIESTFFPLEFAPDVVNERTLFGLLDYILTNKLLLSDTETAILSCFKIYEEKIPAKIAEIAKLTGFTPERVRQLKIKLQNELAERLDFLSLLTLNWDDYCIDTSKDLVEIDDRLTAIINNRDGTGFSRSFIVYILVVTLKNHFTCIGGDALVEKEQQPKNNYYLVNAGFEKVLNANALLSDLRQRMKYPIHTTYALHFDSYLKDFLYSPEIEQKGISHILKMAKELIYRETRKSPDINGDLIFERTTPLKLSDYCKNILSEAGKPLTIIELLKALDQLNTGLELSFSLVRGTLQRNNEFVPIGRTSTFGLKRWEKERETFKGGSIRDIVKELLESSQQPMHISEIATHVKKYRPDTYDRSILDNLKAQQSKLFAFYKNSHIGLLSKKYDRSFEKPKPKPKMFNERLAELREFINLNQRLPYYNSRSAIECSLRRWMDLQIKNGNADTEFNALMQ